ncbi:MAG TPA: hypothetical protein PLQ36_00565 [Candidatus Gracilibacteria bacterium]|nr:hypothetical protein [Candidatus Gracilibacteria bacterium]
MKIRNLKSENELKLLNKNEAKLVVFPYCISTFFLSFIRNSDVYLIKNHESSFKYAWQFILISLIFGWWGIPWGPIYTIKSLYQCLKGGVIQDSTPFKN